MPTVSMLEPLAAVLLLAAPASVAAIDLPPGFEDHVEASGFSLPVDLAFAPDGRMFVAEKPGIVWVVEDGVTLDTPFIDLTDEVNSPSDRGLLGIALDPDFMTNRYVYLLYTVDPVFGEPDESSNDGTFSRLTRYTGTLASGGNRADPDSRLVLIGATFSEGIPVCHTTHTIGSLRFGADGSLLVSAGDGAQFIGIDDGGRDPDCFGPGMFPASEDLGAFRAQSLDSMAGKILRVDPATGLGIDDNPYFSGNAADNRSRVWAYGLRNPCRFAVRPGTGSVSPAHPGTLYIGDVGWDTYEELSVAHRGDNLGWPCFEAFEASLYSTDAEPAASGCETIETPESPGTLTEPLVAWHHNEAALSTPPGFTGRAPAGTVFYNGSCYPETWQGVCFFTDYVRDWIKAVEVDANDQFVALHDFADGLVNPVDLAVHPHTGDLYYVSYAGSIHRLGYEVETAGDLNDDCAVNVGDLLIMLGNWGPCPAPCKTPCLGDVNGDCAVNVSDLLELLGNWG